MRTILVLSFLVFFASCKERPVEQCSKPQLATVVQNKTSVFIGPDYKRVEADSVRVTALPCRSIRHCFPQCEDYAGKEYIREFKIEIYSGGVLQRSFSPCFQSGFGIEEGGPMFHVPGIGSVQIEKNSKELIDFYRVFWREVFQNSTE